MKASRLVLELRLRSVGPGADAGLAPGFSLFLFRGLRVAALQAGDDAVERGLELAAERQQRADDRDRDQNQDQAVLDHPLALLAAKPLGEVHLRERVPRVELQHERLLSSAAYGLL